jgi:DNA-binding CsgD family transcriptional regulator
MKVAAARLPRQSRAPLLGRRVECEILDRLIADVTGGTSRVLLLYGGAGVGKSALLAHLAGCVPGWRVISALGVESEMELPHSALHQLCSPLLEHLDDIPAPQGEALRIVFGLTDGPAPDRFLVSLATVSLIAQAAEERPLACIVDDAQWLDQASAQTLAFVARRLLAERVAFVGAMRPGPEDDVFAGLPLMPVGGLGEADTRALLQRSLTVPLDPAVRDQIVAESYGNPLAVLELPRTWDALRLAGGFGLPDGRPVGGLIEQGYLDRYLRLPEETKLLVLAAAAEPRGDPVLLHRASAALGVDPTAIAPAADEGLLQVRGRVEFAHPLVRSAVYGAAGAQDRRRVHRALAKATNPATDPDRRAWHRARGTSRPDEDVAGDLERSAGGAQARGGLAAAAAFLTRAAELTPDPSRRQRRRLDAAFAHLAAGSLATAQDQLRVARDEGSDWLQQARADLLQARLAFVSRGAREAAPLLLAAARRLEPLDPGLARATYLDAFSAHQFAARFNDRFDVAALAHAARAAAPPPDAATGGGDLLLAAFAALTVDYAGAVPVGRHALAELRRESTAPTTKTQLGWLRHGTVLAIELWDDDAADALSERHVRIARRTGALGELPFVLSSRTTVLVLRGELDAAASLQEEATWVQEAGLTEAPYGGMVLAAWRGREAEAGTLIEHKAGQARARGEGIGLATAEYARAVLNNALGRVDEALAAAQEASADRRELVAHNWGLIELVEAAARSGERQLADDALRRLSAKTRAAGTDWALGIEARCRALLADGEAAEHAFRDAMERIGRSSVRAELARTHLLFGEWLARRRRRTEAREELAVAHRMFTAMGILGFAERARWRLQAVGAAVPAPVARAGPGLTVQEESIARLAADGLSNAEIGSKLFLSARTVEWHLRKVFSKLAIASRRDLKSALPQIQGRRA